MTMVLAVANREYAIQLADRRLTAAGAVVEDEAGKCGSLVCDDAQLLFGFSGIARAGTFSTQRWILDSLYACGPDDFSAFPLLQRFKERATSEFQHNPLLASVSPTDRRLSVLFTGYLYTHDPPVIASALVSNYLDAATDELSPVAWDHFKSFFTSEGEPGAEYSTYVQRIGAHHAMGQADVDLLRAMLRERRPAKAVIDKATELLLAMADHPAAGGTIGKQISWIRIAPDPAAPVENGYYSNVPSRIVYMPSGVVVQRSRQAAFDGGVAWLEGSDAPPLRVPRVARRAPCPCGSGRRYKSCHGAG